MKTHKQPWKGELVLFCRDCLEGVREHDGPKALRNFRRWMAKRAKQDGCSRAMRVADVGCLKMCPKRGLTVTTASLLVEQPAQVAVLRSKADAEEFFRMVVADKANGAERK